MAPKKTPVKRPGGRPPKGGVAATAQKLTLSLTPTDSAILAQIQAEEQKTADKIGVSLSSPDVLRLLLRREAERRGLVDPSTVAKAS